MLCDIEFQISCTNLNLFLYGPAPSREKNENFLSCPSSNKISGLGVTKSLLDRQACDAYCATRT